MKTKNQSLVALLWIAGAALAASSWSSLSVAEEQAQVRVCTRQWYCGWLCKECKTETQWCYDFTSIHTSCRAVVETLHGCEGGKEFKWRNGCFGWVSACLSGRRLCFGSKRSSNGNCSTSVCSAPVGANQSPRDALFAHDPDSSRRVIRRLLGDTALAVTSP